MAPGDVSQTKFYVFNPGNTKIVLSVIAENWMPPTVVNYMTLTWNVSGRIMLPGEFWPSHLNLTVSPAITNITAFNMTIVLIGTETP